MKLSALAIAILAAIAKPLRFEARQDQRALMAPQRERGRFHNRLRGSIKSERGVSRGLHLLSQLSRMGRG